MDEEGAVGRVGEEESGRVGLVFLLAKVEVDEDELL